MTIKQATLKDLDQLVPLFDAYRIFYKQNSDMKRSQSFLEERLHKKDAIIFLAHKDSANIGFMQLYHTFSSVTLQPMLILNDLYVNQNFRGQGVGAALIAKAKQLCKTTNQKGLMLQTGFNNPAQHLYERLGFEKDTDLHMFWKNNETY